MKTQILVIDGGDTFETYEAYLEFLKAFEIDVERYKGGRGDWKSSLQEKLGDEYEVIVPKMPNKNNAQYDEWKLWFDKFIPFLHHGVLLVGHSLGASFLVKYLSENIFPKKIKGVFLVSGVFDVDCDGYTLLSFALPEKLNLQTENIYLYHSSDDPVVPISALTYFSKAFPQAHVRTFTDRKHINQEEFPELVGDIKTLEKEKGSLGN
jgi:predicted alpha/beta hydrolase family esterase